MYLRSRYAMSPMLGGGSNQREGSNGSEVMQKKVVEWFMDDMMMYVGERQAAIAPSRMSRVDKASMPPVWRLRALLRLLYDPSSHSVPIFGTPRHPNHRPSGTLALDTENEMYSLTSRLHLLLMPKSSSNKFEHDFWLKAVLTRVSETDSCVAVLSRTSAILPPNRLARLAHSANGKQGFADSLRRASGAPLEEAWGENFIFTPYNPHQTTVKQWFGFLAGAESFQLFVEPHRHHQQQLADIPIFTPCEKIHSSDIETCLARCLLTAVAVSLSLSSTKLITDN